MLFQLPNLIHLMGLQFCHIKRKLNSTDFLSAAVGQWQIKCTFVKGQCGQDIVNDVDMS